MGKKRKRGLTQVITGSDGPENEEGADFDDRVFKKPKFEDLVSEPNGR